ncbi:aldehyde dehydrogenase [Niallia sp. 01092]|uniref:aldehyde dehydrogenase n=1 Tax=unclassified Niallia TaxID=2837522 RepID=UPI003FD300EC
MELTSKDVEQLISGHQQFFYTNESASIEFRLQQLQKLKAGIEQFKQKIIEALQKDLGKHAFEAYAYEVGFVLSSIRHTLKNLKKWAKRKKVKSPLTLFPSKSYVQYEPYGTVLIIGPFNYPFQLVMEPLIGAIAAGNCVVLKPSELVPSISAVITEMISSIFDENYIRSVEGGVATNTALIQASFDYIFFTGSVSVGKMVMEAAAKNLTPVTLELGGKSPTFVDESANIPIAAQRILWGKTVNAGQTCIAPDYLVVHESVKEDLIVELKKALHTFFGSNVASSKDFGRIVNDKHFNRLAQILQQEEENILVGGNSNAKTRFIEPTLLKADWNSLSMKEEIFGPILPIITYSDLDDVIQSVQKQSKPLALYVFTTNREVEEKIVSSISSGGVCINDTITHAANPYLPFGGIGSSGMGMYHGVYSFFTFSHKRSVLKKNNRWNITTLFPPYTEKKRKLVRKVLK